MRWEREMEMGKRWVWSGGEGERRESGGGRWKMEWHVGASILPFVGRVPEMRVVRIVRGPYQRTKSAVR